MANGVTRTTEPLRELTAAELDLQPQPSVMGAVGPVDEAIADDHPLLERTRELLEYFGGVIFVGPPGTSKSWFAQHIAQVIAGHDSDLVRYVQFHPSYQYEDFVQGYVPQAGGGFDLRPKHLLEMCELARKRPDEAVVLVIDELSRGEPGRVFGEALTYVEKSKRGLNFHLSSGDETSIPDNLVFLCTMNPFDRGVDEVDAAFERRFAKIAMDPNAAVLDELLTSAGMAEDLRSRVRSFFEWINERARANPFAAVGHTFFLDVSDVNGLTRIWEHQLRFLFAKAYQLDPEGLNEVRRRWNALVGLPGATPESQDVEDVVAVGGPGEEETENEST